MDRCASDLRRMSVDDFSAEQVSDWIDASDSRDHSSGSDEPAGDDVEWFLAYTNPRREDDVVRMVKRRSIDAYLPVMIVSRTVSRRRIDVRQVLFPRYVFVALRGSQSLFALRETPGLEGVVKMSGQPSKVRAELVLGLQQQEASGVYDFTDARRAQEADDARMARALTFHVDMPVLIVGGPFREFVAIVEEVFPPDRIGVRLTLFGRPMSVPLLLDDVEHVPVKRKRR